MGGQVLFQDALAARLDLIQPSKSDITTYLEQRDKLATGSSSSEKAHRLTPGVQSLVNKLHAKGKIVYLISGGFRQVCTRLFFLATPILSCTNGNVVNTTKILLLSLSAFNGSLV